MTRAVLFLLVILGFSSCKEKNVENESSAIKEALYEPSEMALLMRQMYEYNKANRARIIKKDSLLPLPDEFLKIHIATLTDPSERTNEFDSLSKVYLKLQSSITVSTQDSVINNFNRTMNSCIECHNTRCVGPIPKIKKLLIQ